MQATLTSPVSFSGTGLHSGLPARVVVRPAPADHGIRFRRTDLARRENIVRAHWHWIQTAPLRTRLVNAAGVAVSTVEHLMAALSGCGVHNALIDIDVEEVPILDGSAAPFVAGFIRSGLHRWARPVRAIKVLEPVEVAAGAAFARLEPAASLEIDFRIAFEQPAIGRQSKFLNMDKGAFVRELCDSRTFCQASDVGQMHADGLALGGTLDNAVVVDGSRILSPGGLRRPDEAVRHKMLDAMGDLALAGGPIVGRYTGHLAGHALTHALLRLLFARPGAFRTIQCDAGTDAQLPGSGVRRADLAGLPLAA